MTTEHTILSIVVYQHLNFLALFKNVPVLECKVSDLLRAIEISEESFLMSLNLMHEEGDIHSYRIDSDDIVISMQGVH